jgi:hypothetical protein
MDYVEFEVFRIVLIIHEAGYNTLKQFFVYATGSYMIDNSLHALHEAVSMPIVAVIHKEPNADCKRNPFI